MTPKDNFEKLAAAVVKRSGICRATVEAVLPHIFDEIRYQLAEGNQCVAIESFGTFAVVKRPERSWRYTYNGADEIRHRPADLHLKFSPTRNLRREAETGRFDPEHHSFQRFPGDPALRHRKGMRYNHRSKVYKFPVGEKGC